MKNVNTQLPSYHQDWPYVQLQVISFDEVDEKSQIENQHFFQEIIDKLALGDTLFPSSTLLFRIVTADIPNMFPYSLIISMPSNVRQTLNDLPIAGRVTKSWNSYSHQSFVMESGGEKIDFTRIFKIRDVHLIRTVVNLLGFRSDTRM